MPDDPSPIPNPVTCRRQPATRTPATKHQLQGCSEGLPFGLRSFVPRGASHNNRGPDGVCCLIVLGASAWCLAPSADGETPGRCHCDPYRWKSKIGYGWHARRDVRLLPSTIRSRFACFGLPQLIPRGLRKPWNYPSETSAFPVKVQGRTIVQPEPAGESGAAEHTGGRASHNQSWTPTAPASRWHHLRSRQSLAARSQVMLQADQPVNTIRSTIVMTGSPRVGQP
jgi:hypothetical protein